MRLFFTSAFLFLTYISVGQNVISGKVYHDQNQNGKWDKQEEVLKGVVISNGTDIALTNEQGEYSIQTIPQATVFLIQPKGWSTKLGDYNISQFYIPYQELDQVTTHDFPLQKTNQDSYVAALLGDMQVDVSDDVQHVEKLVVNELIEDKPDLIFPLGDLSFDNLDIFESLAQSLALVQSPVYYVIGNHDLDFERPIDQRDFSFRNIFGPSHYALEYGDELFIVLNNILPTEQGQYVSGLDQRQKEFLKQVLNHYQNKIDSVVILMHIPIQFMQDKQELLDLVSSFKDVRLISGHTHTQYHDYYPRENKSDVHQLVAGALCGSWWQGPHDLEGIPFALMYDGTRKGYWKLHNDTQKESFLSYKVSGLDKDKQMHIWIPSQRQWDTLKNQLNDGYIYANVFAGDPFTKVEISLDNNSWIPMQRFLGEDPYYKELSLLQQQGRFDSLGISKVNNANRDSEHLWRFKIPQDLPKGKHVIRIRATNAKLALNHTQVGVYSNI